MLKVCRLFVNCAMRMRDRRRPQNENLSVVYCFLGRGCDMEYDDKRENQTLQKKETDDVKMH